MGQSYFITGYPGFLASNLLKQLIHDHHKNIEKIYLLVLPHFKEEASISLEQIIHTSPLQKEQFTFIIGDITKENLGVQSEEQALLQRTVTHVFHLAAIYDLVVPQPTAYKVNVTGTKHVNNWIKGLQQLERYIYFSTAYVSGKREGRILEGELIAGQAFKNHYEQTKYVAEVLVQEQKDTIPTTIIRPGVVKGDSKTGATIKFDGLYFMLNLLDKLRFSPIIPFIGDGNAEGNFVPVDYVLQATSYLAIHPIGEGKTYHLTDPNPYQMWEIQQLLTSYYLGKSPKGTIPITAAKAPLAYKPVRKWLKAEPEAMDYFLIHATYDCSQAVTDLQGSGITCPDLKETLEPMIAFYRKYKDDYTRHIPIS
ncbi:Thioester reductase domain-containing protein [Oceanobacillus limi]|uniref:Thioester reductase domain-containing protein n=1 Tax=Oceanobacillus limi TaxID=930131 RepID=A0A1H9YEQ4_9BACI|nr:SDR family oxidoreductase [Oceanobacillus limi]SES67473.1 Thioester reductase domain-containing protein [Oceanobacillus limi]